MSHNPWPFVVVALGSLGFLANSMAQNNNRFENPSLEYQETSAPFRGELSATSNTFESFDAFEGRSLAADREPALRRDDASAKIIHVQPTSRTATSDLELMPRLPADPSLDAGLDAFSRREPLRVAQTPDREPVSGLPVIDFGARRRSNADRGLDRVTVTQKDIDAAYLDRPFNETRHTSLLGERKSLLATLGVNPNLDVPFRTASNNGLSGTLEQGQKKLSDTLRNVTPGSVPLWLTLGLFLSLPANFFFGWIAMSMHARYQDLLEDMQISENRRSRETRRRRVISEDRDVLDAPRERRSRREQDEEAFLNGGLEV